MSLTSVLRATSYRSARREVIYPRPDPQVQHYWNYPCHHRVGDVVYLCPDGQSQGSSDLREKEGKVVTISPFGTKHQLIVYRRQLKNDWVTTESDHRPSHSTIVLSPLPTRPFNPDNASGGQRWDESGNAIGWSDEFPLQPAKHAIRPTAGEGRDPPNHGRDSMTRSNALEHSTGPHKNGPEVLATSYESRQHLRTRSFSGFHRNVTR